VINLQRENWAQRRRVKGEDVIAVPAGMDLQQAAMLRINPPTALLLLTDFVALKPGDWVMQNVANSAVGRLVIRLARDRGVKTVNVVRREALFAELKALGADACVVDGPALAESVKAQTGGAPIRLGIEAVGGQAAARMATCLGEGGVVVSYGSMSGEDPVMPRYVLSNLGVTLAGFTLGRGLARRSPAEVRAIYADLGGQVLRGNLSAPVEKVYPIEEIKAAVAHAQQGERSGKILVKP
jgi:NADPH:quinone reductase-like Zn-dependent oxidoreductase